MQNEQLQVETSDLSIKTFHLFYVSKGVKTFTKACLVFLELELTSSLPRCYLFILSTPPEPGRPERYGNNPSLKLFTKEIWTCGKEIKMLISFSKK